MQSRKTKSWLMTLLFSGMCAGILHASCAADANCDRECMHGLIAKYSDSMLEHDPGMPPFSSEIRLCRRYRDGEAGGRIVEEPFRNSSIPP